MGGGVTVQIYTGGFDSAPEPLDIPSILKKLEKIRQRANIAGVMIGWSPNADIGAIAGFLRRHGIGVYLWLPVFSGWDGLSPLMGGQGRPAEQGYLAEKGERFDFGCPANPENVRHVIRIFEERYAAGPYDGIFLDKIRFPSFISGIQPVLTCFCPHCRPLHGISERFEPRGGENPLGITAYEGLRYTLADEALAGLFAYKSEAVTASAAVLSGYFRKRGYKVGLDLFAPFLSYFVGQDYGKLAPYADFIKPMFYRKTNAPAGIPFELDMYAAAFGGSPQEIEGRGRYLLKTLQTSGIGMDFINREIAGIREIAGDVKLYAGIEVNYHERVAPVTARYIQENVTGIKNADGIALSWDLCSTPGQNLDAALMYIKQ
ncbi:MAG: hypothetical protein FWH06_02015 [Oscillospiraceae bacterium]|nr:hypothetical protein [Oscillospiraceae bacterium]